MVVARLLGNFNRSCHDELDNIFAPIGTFTKVGEKHFFAESFFFRENSDGRSVMEKRAKAKAWKASTSTVLNLD